MKPWKKWRRRKPQNSLPHPSKSTSGRYAFSLISPKTEEKPVLMLLQRCRRNDPPAAFYHAGESAVPFLQVQICSQKSYRRLRLYMVYCILQTRPSITLNERGSCYVAAGYCQAAACHCDCIRVRQAGRQTQAPIHFGLADYRHDPRAARRQPAEQFHHGRRLVYSRRKHPGMHRRPDDRHRTDLEPDEKVR